MRVSASSIAITPNHLPSVTGANACSTICSQGVVVEATATPDADATASHQDNSTSPLLLTIITHPFQRTGSTSPNSFANAMHLAGAMVRTWLQTSTAVSVITAALASSYRLLLHPSRQPLSNSNRCSCLIAAEHPFTHLQNLIAAVDTPTTIPQTISRCQVMTAQIQEKRSRRTCWNDWIVMVLAGVML